MTIVAHFHTTDDTDDGMKEFSSLEEYNEYKNKTSAPGDPSSPCGCYQESYTVYGSCGCKYEYGGSNPFCPSCHHKHASYWNDNNYYCTPTCGESVAKGTKYKTTCGYAQGEIVQIILK